MSRSKYRINENYFDSIDTEQKAYWLGFLYADGYNNEDHREITVRLHIKDESHLLKLRDELFPDHDKPLYYPPNKTACELAVYNVHMCEALRLNGCMQAKSFKVRFPFEIITKDLYSHFIRGVFDGDGCISTSVLNTGEHKTVFSIIGYNLFMQEINHILSESCDLNENKLIGYKGKDERIATVAFSGCRQCIKIRNYLYNNAHIYLERKKEKFDKLGTDEWRTYENLKKPKVKKEKKARKRTHFNIFEDIDDKKCAMIIKGNNIYIDKDVQEKVQQYTWHIEQKRVVHSYKTESGKVAIYLSRFLTNAQQGQSVIHIDGNPYNYCIDNLKVRNHR